MEEISLSARIDEKSSLFISTLCRSFFDEDQAEALGGYDGYFICISSSAPRPNLEILAKAPDRHAAESLFRLFSARLQTSN